MNAITFKGRKGCFKRNKIESQWKKETDRYFPIVDRVIESALSQSFSPNFVDSFMKKLINSNSSFYESVRCAYLSTSTFQPLKFYQQLKQLLLNEQKLKKNIQYYDSLPSLSDALGDVKKGSDEYIGVFNISEAFDKKFFKKFVDLLMERSHNAVLIFVTMFNLGDELGFLGLPCYVATIYDQKNFVEIIEEKLTETPLPSSTVEKELDLFENFHRSERVLCRRLKFHLVKAFTKEEDGGKEIEEPSLAHSFGDYLNEPGLEDYKVVYEMLHDIAYEHRPIAYSEVLERFEDYKHKSMPKYLKKYSIEYYFRVILDSFMYCGIIERKAENAELIKFYPVPMYDLIKQNILNM